MDSGFVVLCFLFLLFAVPLYFMPIIIALNNGNTRKGGVFVINLLFGWTLIGWLLAMSFAITQTPKAMARRLHLEEKEKAAAEKYYAEHYASDSPK